jgi:hypothetical protein
MREARYAGAKRRPAFAGCPAMNLADNCPPAARLGSRASQTRCARTAKPDCPAAALLCRSRGKGRDASAAAGTGKTRSTWSAMNLLRRRKIQSDCQWRQAKMGKGRLGSHLYTWKTGGRGDKHCQPGPFRCFCPALCGLAGGPCGLNFCRHARLRATGATAQRSGGQVLLFPSQPSTSFSSSLKRIRDRGRAPFARVSCKEHPD